LALTPTKRETVLRAFDAAAGIDSVPNIIPFAWARDLSVDFSRPQLVEDLIYPGAFVLTYGESNTGKTFLMFDLAVTISQGKQWFGRDTMKGLVVYIAGEGVNGVALRKMAYEQRQILGPDAQLVVITRAVDFLTDAADIPALVALIKQLETDSGHKCVAVFVDTLARAIPGGSDSEATDMGMFIKGADAVRAQLDCALIAIHHAGKDISKGARGHSSLRAAVDTELLVEGQADPRQVSCTKQRDLERAPSFAFDLELQVVGHNPKGKPVTSCVVKVTDEASRPRTKLTKQTRLAFTALSEAIQELGKSPSTALIQGTKSHVPLLVISLDDWRAFLTKRDIFGGSPDANKKAYQRAKLDLQDQGLIEISDGYVWITRDKGT